MALGVGKTAQEETSFSGDHVPALQNQVDTPGFSCGITGVILSMKMVSISTLWVFLPSLKCVSTTKFSTYIFRLNLLLIRLEQMLVKLNIDNSPARPFHIGQLT